MKLGKNNLQILLFRIIFYADDLLNGHSWINIRGKCKASWISWDDEKLWTESNHGLHKRSTCLLGLLNVILRRIWPLFTTRILLKFRIPKPLQVQLTSQITCSSFCKHVIGA